MGLVVLGLGIGIIFSKKKAFPEGSISKNKDMQRLKLLVQNMMNFMPVELMVVAVVVLITKIIKHF